MSIFSTLKSNTKLIFTTSSSLSKRDKKRKKRVINRATGFLLILLQIIISVMFLYLLFRIDVVPDKYMVMLIIVLLLVTSYNIVSQYSKAHILGKVISIILSVAMLVCSPYIINTHDMLDSLSEGSDIRSDTMSIIVLAGDPANSLKDAKNYTFGYEGISDKDNSQKTLAQIANKLDKTVLNKEYDTGLTDLANALYDGEVKAIILNEANRSFITDEIPTFTEDTKIIDTFTLTTKLTLSASEKKVNEEPFTIYIAGNDQTGSLNASGLHDVNIIATFHPKTRQLLLVTTPRDYYIPVDSVTNGVGFDKLTHAGSLGIESSIATLQNLYGVTIDYYVRVNFTGTVDIIDALGGITIDSEVAFTTTYETSPVPYTFKIGPNECDGAKALAFCRERKYFDNGDNQRGINQMAAITAMINKATSASILQNYSQVMDSVSGCFATNMPTSSMTSLMKGMLTDTTPWNVQSYHVTALKSDFRPSYFFPGTANGAMSVQLPDYDSINTAIELIGKITNGEVFDVEEYLENSLE